MSDLTSEFYLRFDAMSEYTHRVAKSEIVSGEFYLTPNHSRLKDVRAYCARSGAHSLRAIHCEGGGYPSGYYWAVVLPKGAEAMEDALYFAKDFFIYRPRPLDGRCDLVTLRPLTDQEEHALLSRGYYGEADSPDEDFKTWAVIVRQLMAQFDSGTLPCGWMKKFNPGTLYPCFCQGDTAELAAMAAIIAAENL